jgi:hypothetical protein
MPTVVRLPEVPTVYWAPLTPKLREVLFFPIFQRTPGKSLIDLLKRKKPMVL